MPIFHHAKAWEEYGIEYAVHKELWNGCVLATLGPQQDKGDKARDFSGRRNHGTLKGATHLPTWGNATYRGLGFRSLTLDATEDYITCGTSASLNPSAELSISSWMYRTRENVTETLVSRADAYILRMVSKKIAFIVYTDGTNFTLEEHTDPLANTVGSWLNVIGTYTNAYGAMYLNGVLKRDSTSGTGTIDSTANPTTIGIHGSGALFSGGIAAVGIWSRVLTASERLVIASHPLAAYEVWLPEYFFGASTAVTLTVAGSAVDVTSDSPTLTQHNTLAVGNAVCSVTSGNVALVQHSALTVQSSQLATSSQSPALTQHNALTVADSKCVVSSETLALTQHSALTVQGSVCAVTAGNIALTQHAALTVQDCSVTLNSQSPELTQHSVLTIGNSQCAATSQGVALTQHNALACGNATCAVASENVVLTAHAPAVVTLTVQGSTCVISSTSPVLTQHGALIVASSQCLVSSGNVTLAYHAAGAALILEHQTLLLAI
jgi:hypothetical protein